MPHSPPGPDPGTFDIVFRDEHLAVLDKPPGVSLLADRGGAGCLWDVLPDRLGTKPYLVHRLDKGTSGALLVALDPSTQRRLTRAFQARAVRKYYLAWVTGAPPEGRTLTIDLPLRQGRKSRYRVAGPRASIRRTASGWSLGATDGDGHPSVTRLRVLRRRGERTLVLAAPVTGRTHQIRVHLTWIGHPLLGDHLYGRPDDPARQAPRLQLHCHRLVVPGYGSFAAAAPKDWLPG